MSVLYIVYYILFINIGYYLYLYNTWFMTHIYIYREKEKQNSFKLKIHSSWCFFPPYFIMDTFFFGSHFVPSWANCCASWKHSVCYHFHWQWSYRSHMAMKPPRQVWNVPIKHTALWCPKLLQYFVGCSCQVSSDHSPVCPWSQNRKEKKGEKTPWASFRPRSIEQTTFFISSRRGN